MCGKPVKYPHPRARFCSGKCAGDHVVGFFKSLKHTTGSYAGKPFILEPWQEHDIIRPIFGTLGEDGLRVVRVAYVEVPCKNGKSTLAAGVALYLLTADGEASAQVAGAACDRDQARIVHREAEKMVRQDKALSDKCNVYRASKEIEYLPNDGIYKAISADAFRQEGLNLNGAILDELHRQRWREFFDVLRKRMSARDQPLFFIITTAGTDRESIGWEVHNQAVKIIAGDISMPEFFAYVAAAPEDADWIDIEVHKKCNPALGTFKNLKDVELEIKEAIESPAKQNSLLRYHLNIWTHAESPLIDMHKWHECNIQINAGALKGRTCYAGLDLAEKWDFAALALCFPEPDDVYKWLWYYWYPGADILERGRLIHAPLDQWAKDGHIKLTEGNIISKKQIKKDIGEIATIFRIEELGYDPWKASELASDLNEEYGIVVADIAQGHRSLGEATVEMLDAVKDGKFHHGNHPITTWMASAVVGRYDINMNVVPNKKKSKQKIDGISAAVNALERALFFKKQTYITEDTSIPVWGPGP
jgi:phage terminase large subunit-like protein